MIGEFIMARNKETTNAKPDYNVFTVQDRGNGQDPFWLKVGAGFEHKDKKGFNISLQALPTDSRLVLREYKEKEEN